MTASIRKRPADEQVASSVDIHIYIGPLRMSKEGFALAHIANRANQRRSQRDVERQ